MFNLRNRLGMLAGAALLSVAASANATTFDISYVFGDGQTITGSVDGTLDGAYIDGLTNLHLSYDGVDFGSALTVTTWDAATSSFDPSIPARISANASLNQFLVTDSTGNYSFGVLDAGDGSGQQIFASNLYKIVNNAAGDAPINASWSVTAVPEPASVALLIAGLGMVGVSARRRRPA